jgi:hypothetical protein
VPTLGGLKAPGPCYLALNYALQRTEESDAERKSHADVP